MATVSPTATTRDAAPPADIFAPLEVALRYLGSLKITVALFAFSLIIVLVGTLAQDELNMQQVKERYFLTWIASLHINDFFPQAFFPHDRPIDIRIPFPGGALIGTLLMINLVAAKITRFKIHSSGPQLIAGVVFLAIGAAITTAIIFSGHSSDGLQGAPPISYDVLWRCVQIAMGAGAVGLAFAAVSQKNRLLLNMGCLIAVAIAIVLIYTLVTGYRVGDPGLRIVWQLTKGLGAGLILMVGCILVFDRQGGNVLLHLGVALLMAGQFTFGDRQLEQRMSLVEGESTNALVNMDRLEMTIISRSEEKDDVIAIPGSRLANAAEFKTKISDEKLPVDIKVVKFFPNSKLEETKAGGSNPATTGIGTEYRAIQSRPHGGTDSSINVASAYVELIDKSSGESIGTHLVSQLISDRQLLFPGEATEDQYDDFSVADTEYKLGLKFHREVKPYWVQLEDVRRMNYIGTETPRDYSSFIRIVDPETGEDRRERIWMNNPLRYRGETFFQSSYAPLPGGKELTGLQVVRNSGWLIPYVACSITALGMLVHFLGTLRRFVSRREREVKKQRSLATPADGSGGSGVVVALAIAAMTAFAVVSLVPWKAVYTTARPAERDNQFDFYELGKLPTQFGGRVLPLDAYARQTLKTISNRESLYLEIPETYADADVEATNVAFTQDSDDADSSESEISESENSESKSGEENTNPNDESESKENPESNRESDEEGSDGELADD